MTTQGRSSRETELAKHEYLTDPNYPTLRKLSEKHGVAYHLLTYRCTREKWLDQREAFHDRVATESLHRAMRDASKKRVKDVAIVDRLTDLTMADLGARLNAKNKWRKAVAEWEILTAEEKEKIAPPMPPAGVFDASPTDINTLMRLKSFMIGDPDSRMEISGDVKIQISKVVYAVIDSIKSRVADHAVRGAIIEDLKGILKHDGVGADQN